MNNDISKKCSNCFFYHEEYPSEEGDMINYCGLYDNETNEIDSCDSFRISEYHTIRKLQAQLKTAREVIELSVKEHAETCSLFIYDDKDCTCHYNKARQWLKENK